MRRKTFASSKIKIKSLSEQVEIVCMLRRLYFFDVKGVIKNECVSREQTINQNYYSLVLTTLIREEFLKASGIVGKRSRIKTMGGFKMPLQL